MTDQEYELLCQFSFHAERMACLNALLETFDATGPFCLCSETKEAQHQELSHSLRIFTCICDLARYYSEEARRDVASVCI